MNRLTSKLNPTDATDECHPDIFKADSLKVQKLLFRCSLRAVNSLATSIRQSLSVLCLWVLSIVRLLNLVCVIVERSHVFSLQTEEKDFSPAALIAGFTRRSLHRVMISVIIQFSASESCLILAKMSSKLKCHQHLKYFQSNIQCSEIGGAKAPNPPPLHPARSLLFIQMKQKRIECFG